MAKKSTLDTLKSGERARLQLDVDYDEAQELIFLKKKLGASSYAEVMRRALKFLRKELEKGVSKTEII